MVDLAGVRQARAELDRLAREHPHLLGESNAVNRSGWEATLHEEEMTESRVITFRFPPQLIERIDRYAGQLAGLAGVGVARTRVVVKLLELGLAQVEAADPRDPGTRKRHGRVASKGAAAKKRK